jgi:hypothetical protein
MVHHRLWMIFGGFTHPIYSVCSRYIIYFTVPLCSCITGLGSEQPLLFYLLYSAEITYGINSVISKLMTFAENAETGQFLFLIMLILS